MPATVIPPNELPHPFDRRQVPDLLLTQDAVADHLGICARTLERWRMTGEGPTFVKIGRAVRYPESALTEWITAHQHHSTADGGTAPSVTSAGHGTRGRHSHS